MNRLIISQILIVMAMAACVPADNAVVAHKTNSNPVIVKPRVKEPVNKPVMVQPRIIKSPIKSKPPEVKEPVNKPVIIRPVLVKPLIEPDPSGVKVGTDKNTGWNCKRTNNVVINQWKLKYKCDKLTN